MTMPPRAISPRTTAHPIKEGKRTGYRTHDRRPRGKAFQGGVDTQIEHECTRVRPPPECAQTQEDG